jgi:hypothetical protein
VLWIKASAKCTEWKWKRSSDRNTLLTGVDMKIVHSGVYFQGHRPSVRHVTLLCCISHCHLMPVCVCHACAHIHLSFAMICFPRQQLLKSHHANKKGQGRNLHATQHSHVTPSPAPRCRAPTHITKHPQFFSL